MGNPTRWLTKDPARGLVSDARRALTIRDRTTVTPAPSDSSTARIDWLTLPSSIRKIPTGALIRATATDRSTRRLGAPSQPNRSSSTEVMVWPRSPSATMLVMVIWPNA